MAANDFIHVADVSAAIKILVESDDTSGIYNIGSGQLMAVSDIVNKIAINLGGKKLYQDLPLDLLTGLAADISRIKKVGWYPSISIEAGLASTIDIWNSQ